MGRMVNKEQTPSLQSKPNEGFQLHRPELLIAAAHGDSDEINRLLLLHREEDAARQQVEVVVLNVEDTVADDVEKPAATAIPPSEEVTGAGDSVLHVVASSGDGDEFLKCATVIVSKANHLLSTPNRKGDTPLHCAARLGNARMVSHLLGLARAGDSTSDDEFLKIAMGNVSKANDLLDARNLKGDTPLPCAARLRNARMISHLLALARAGDGTSDDERVKAILRMQNLKGETVLHEAVRLEDKEMIEVLLSTNSELACVPLTDRASPLYLALSLGHRDIALQLLENDKELSYSGPDGQNAFHAAILWKQGKEIIEKLLERNKDLIKQADRFTGRTPLHYAALFGETRVTELLLSTDPSAAYLPDRNGSFPIHLAASNGQPDNVLALLQKSGPGDYSKKQESGPGDSPKKEKKKSTIRTFLHYCAQLRDGKVGRWLSRLAKSDSSKEQNSGPYCAQLRDDKGRTFLHVAVQDKSWDVVKYACQEQGKMLASSVMNMQDNDGNTALHLAVEVGDIRIVRDLVSIAEVKLNLKNNKEETPRELASIRYKQQGGTHSRYSSTPSRIYGLLDDAAHLTAPRENILSRDAAHLTASPWENILRIEIHNNEEDKSQNIAGQTQIIGLGSVLITTVTFAAAFAVPGGYRADGTPTLAGQYAFDAFVMANTLAFIFSGLSIIFLMFAGLGTESGRRIFSLLSSVNFLGCSARSLGAAFALGMYSILAPVEAFRTWTCGVTGVALVLVEAHWGVRAVKMVYNDNVVLVKRFGCRHWRTQKHLEARAKHKLRYLRAWGRLARAFLVRLILEFGPYVIISTSLMPRYKRVH